MLRGLRKAWPIALLMAVVELWVYGGGSLGAKSLAHYSRREPVMSSFDSRFDGLLGEVADVIRDGAGKTKSAPELGFRGIDRLRQLKKTLAEEDSKTREYFDEVESFIGKKRLTGEILARQREFIREYESKYYALMSRLDAIESAHNDATGFLGKLTGANKRVDWNGVLGRAEGFLSDNSPQARRPRLDPNNLPHRSLRADRPIPPKLTREEWIKAFSNPAPSKNEADARKATSAQSARAASAPAFLLATAPPSPADLAETIEVKFTPDIQQLADSLGRNPVKIYNWVRNNIEFVPIWGSIQGAQLCLETRSCNAFDTSSLLIALLRVSGVPARYQMGTIEVPVEKFKNWAGGFTNTEAAASLFASGGVPSVVRRVNQTGQVVTVTLEHVWVKAFVDYAPSAGVVHLQGDSWVELDAGYKQYTFNQGLDFEAAIPTNFLSFAIQAAQGAITDPATGAVTRIDSAGLHTLLQQQANQRRNFLQTNLPNATVREAFGGRRITTSSLIIFPATLPNRVLARANDVSQVPDNLRHRVTIGLEAGLLSNLSTVWSFSASLPELAGKNLLLLYSTASQADEQLLRQAQSTLPPSLNLIPQLYVGAQLVVAGGPLRIGSPVVSRIQFSSPTISTPTVSNNMRAGEAAAIGLDLLRITRTQMQDIQQKAQALAGRIQQGQNLTNREFNEVMLSSNILTWFSRADLMNELSARVAGVVTIRYPSAGLFSFKLSTTSLFGAVASVSPDGFSMDIDRDVVVSVAKDGDTAKAATLAFIQGSIGSASESESPVRMLSPPGEPASGVATMQALRLANDQGIPIYRINSSNASALVPLLQIDPVDLADVQDAVNAGLEVVVSKTPVDFNGRAVLGTVIRDVGTGSASFLISGGTNGAVILAQSLELQLQLFQNAVTTGGRYLGPLGIILAILVDAVLLVSILLTVLAITFELGDTKIFALSPCEMAGVIAGGVGLIVSIPSLGAALVAAGFTEASASMVYLLQTLSAITATVSPFLC